MLTVCLYLVVFPIFASSQFLSYDAIRMRVPGRCMLGDYDCGLGQCVPISQFRDGKPDCMDGSDEWCFIGQVSCGPVYCADYKDALPCIVYPKCDGSSKQLPWCSTSKEKLCADETSFPCKGYGECVLWEWLLDGKKDCNDGSDEDENYVMPLEHAYRCARNQSGLYLPKPVPPPPEDHPSLYVEGCSMCSKPSTVTLPSNPVIDYTTPKYPFITSPLLGNTKPPLSNFPVFPSEESKLGDFFPEPSGVEISRVTGFHKPNEPIGDFFPTHSSTPVPPTEAVTQSHTFRLITIPSISQTQFPQAPLIFPGRPDLPPITAPSPLNNWPIPIVTTTPDPHHQGPLPPITYPTIEEGSEKIPPIKPGIIISRPVTSRKPDLPSEFEYGGGTGDGISQPPGMNPFDMLTRPSVPMTTPGPFDMFPNVPPVDLRPVTRPWESEKTKPYPGVTIPDEQKSGTDTLIPLIPGRILPTFATPRPLSIPSFFTTPQSPHRPFVTQNPPHEGFIEEKTLLTPSTNNAQTTQIDRNLTPKTTTLKATSRTKIIHVGPNGVVEEIDNNESTKIENETNLGEHEGQIVPGSDKVIHIGPTVKTTPTPSSGTSTIVTENSSTFESVSTSSVPTTTVKTGDPQVDDCLRRMSDSGGSVICDCPNGQFKNTGNGQCEETLSLVVVKVKVNTVCNTDKASLEQKQRILHQKIGQSYKSCIRSAEHDSALVAIVQCSDCTLQEIDRLLTTRSFGEPGNLNLTAEALGTDLCSNSEFNHCHVYSDCILDDENLRYACKCKKGTTDSSDGYGRSCEGFPEESDCVMVFGICLIVWLIFLLGSFFLSLLACIACYALCRKRCCRYIAIHPANADGLQTVVVGQKAAKSLEMDGNREKLPHMKAIFAESLKHSAKGSTSVASAFALADFKRKKVSRPPDMSQVIEEVNENPTASIHNSESLPKVSSLAKISTHTANSEPPTPVGVIETPILEKNSSSVSLVSANDNAPQLPSLPLPLPVPITTSASTTNLEETTGKENGREGGGGSHASAQEQQVPETERPASSHSVGVQPTIWETYRVLGQQYSKSDLTERKASVDSLEQMFEARLAETSRTTKTIPTVRTDKSDNSAIIFTAKPYKKDTEKETDSKLADMIGVTSFHKPDTPSRPDSGKKDAKVIPKTGQVESEPYSPTLEKSLEAALLIEMAKRGIELPLSPKTPIPIATELEKAASANFATAETSEDSEVKPYQPQTPKKPESRKSSAKSSASSKRSKIPSTSQSRVGSAKKQISQIDEQDKEPDVFVPQGAKAIYQTKRILRRSGGAGGVNELVPSTDESDPEVAFFKKLDRIKQDSRNYPAHPYRKYSRRRKPERTLSSISEKSAEIAAEAALDYPQDTSISCPATTRTFLEPRFSMAPRYVFKRKVVEASEETSDVDMPRLSPARHAPPVVSSPEIPDVSLQRSMENLHKLESKVKPQPPYPQTPTKKSNLMKKKTGKNESSASHPSSSLQSSRHSSKFASKATTPRTGDATPASMTSRSTRHSVISRKIAIRRQELKAVTGSARDLSGSRVDRVIPTHSLRGAKSVGDLSKRQPNWDISPYRDTPGPSSFLPPITPSRHVRTAANSPQPRHRRSDSHFSMTSLPLIAHSPTSFWSSPHFHPSEDSKKPPKEDLWWNPNKRS
eukprot:NP_508629.2 Uncharacterized protein CELE_R11G1.1 [Caenorhabditis elegans]